MPVETSLSEASPSAAAQVNADRQFPSRVVSRLRRCRQQLLAAASGDLLDLNLTGSPAKVEAAIGNPQSGYYESGHYESGRYDMAIGVAALVGVSDVSRFLGGVATLLRSDGVLWLVEPAYQPGLGAALTTTMWSRHPALRDLHVGRNLITVIRSLDFTITDIERLTMPTSVRPLRTFLSIRAERFGR